MVDKPNFEAFAALLREVTPAAKEYPAWVDRPDLPDRVRALWRAVGVPPIAKEMLPKASKQEDELVLADVFERWFEDALTRDRWAFEPEDEPIPWRRLPPHPRAVGDYESRILVVSDVDPEPTLHTVRQGSPESVPCAFGYSYWCMRTLLIRATRQNAVYYPVERTLELEPSSLAPDIGVSRVREGIYSIAPFLEEEGRWLLYRDIDTFTEFAMALSPEELGCFGKPSGLTLDVRLSKKQDLDPIGKRIDPRFTPIHDESGNPRHTRLVGRIEGRWAWIEAHVPARHVRVKCDPSAGEAVKAWLEKGGAKITSSDVFNRTSYSYW